MAYSVQLLTEVTKGKHNIQDWILEEVSQIDKEDIEFVHTRALTFLDNQAKELGSKARIEELAYYFESKEATATAITNAVLQTVIAIKPQFLIRGGVEVAFPGVSPIQAIATQIGLHLHHDQLDAVQTGMEILADFQDIGIYTLRFGTNEHQYDTAIVQSNFSEIEELQSKIKATMYLPPMLIQPQTII